MKAKSLVGSILVAGALLGSGLTQATPFQNGSFELGAVNPGGGFATVVGSTAITGWTVSPGNVDYIGTYWTAADGTRSVDLAGNTLGTISQTFDTLTGVVYDVVFAMAANPDHIARPRTLKVSAGDESGIYSFNTSGTTLLNMGWTDFSFQFTADAAQTTLSFEALNQACCFGPALDNVRVSQVPEPSALALLGLALAGLVAVRRGKRA